MKICPCEPVLLECSDCRRASSGCSASARRRDSEEREILAGIGSGNESPGRAVKEDSRSDPGMAFDLGAAAAARTGSGMGVSGCFDPDDEEVAGGLGVGSRPAIGRPDSFDGSVGFGIDLEASRVATGELASSPTGSRDDLEGGDPDLAELPASGFITVPKHDRMGFIKP